MKKNKELFELDKRFEQIIARCEKWRSSNLKGGFYNEKYKKQLDAFSEEIIKNKLVEKCVDIDFAKQLCIKYWLRYEKDEK